MQCNQPGEYKRHVITEVKIRTGDELFFEFSLSASVYDVSARNMLFLKCRKMIRASPARIAMQHTLVVNLASDSERVTEIGTSRFRVRRWCGCTIVEGISD